MSASRPPVLVWTRGLADWQDDQLRLNSSGLGELATIVHLPCIRTVAVASKIPSGPWHAAVITSATVLQHASPALLHELKQCKAIYTHGEKTAEAVRAAQLPVHWLNEARTAEGLERLVSALLPAGASILLPGAAEPAFDMAASLMARGHAARHVPCYRTEEALAYPDGTLPKEAEIRAFVDQWQGLACFTSPSAVRAFVKGLNPKGNRLYQGLTGLALGPTTARAMEEHFAHIKIAPVNAVASLIQLAKDTLNPHLI